MRTKGPISCPRVQIPRPICRLPGSRSPTLPGALLNMPSLPRGATPLLVLACLLLAGLGTAFAGNRAGSGGVDRLVGSASSDRLLGLGGNDALVGAGGSDTLHGGNGNDRIKIGRAAWRER